ncbi:MAG: alpha-L-fucosidase [Candidatus Thorarchaeota archaeon]
MDPLFTAQENFQDLRFGMFIHFGLYSVGEEHEWHMYYHKVTHDSYKTNFLYRFEPDPSGIEQWILTAKDMGAKYLICTSKHHDGFCLWDTKIPHKISPDFHIRNTPFWGKNQKSILDYLFEAGRKHGIRIGLYYSSIDWSWTQIEKQKDQPQYHVLLEEDNLELHKHYINYYQQQVLELISLYPDILCVWFDGYQFNHPLYPEGFLEYLDYLSLYQAIKKINPSILVGSNSGSINNENKMGIIDFLLFENIANTGELNGAPWPRNSKLPGEVCLSINKTWGYAKNDKNYKNSVDIQELVINNSIKNANTLLNFGPKPDGFIVTDQLKIANNIGNLLLPYSELLYGTRNISIQNWGGIVQNPSTKSIYLFFSHHLNLIEIEKPGNFNMFEWIIGYGEVFTKTNSTIIISNIKPKSVLKLSL